MIYAELRSHPKNEEILSALKPSVRDRFDDWAIEAVNKGIREKEVEILRIQNLLVANAERGWVRLVAMRYAIFTLLSLPLCMASSS